MENKLTGVAIVYDCACEDLLVILKLQRSQMIIFESLSGDNVNGRLFLSSTC